MSTKKRIMQIIPQLIKSCDISVNEYQGQTLIFIQDFLGFTDDWDIEERELNRPDLVDELEELVNQLDDDSFSISYDSDEI